MKQVSVIQNFVIIACQIFTYKICNKVIRLNKIEKTRAILGIVFGVLFILSSCNLRGKKGLDETPTRGDITICVDESYQPIIDSQIYTFTSLYNYAKITPLYKPEVDVINAFMNDSVKVIVTNKQLSDAQIQYLKDSLIIARTTTVAYDALALICNKSNTDTLIDYQDIRAIFQGEVKTWKELNPKSKLEKILVVFDNTKSGNIRYFKEKFELTKNLPENFYAVNSNPEVVDYISKNPNAIGIISVNWISDKDDSLSRDFIGKVNIMAVSAPYLNDGSYYQPLQGNIYNKSYPFTREVYMISRETFSGLGSGFISWVAAEQGQRIVLKSGLVPATMPIRLIQIKKDF